jgi:phosphohistidine phosphatase
MKTLLLIRHAQAQPAQLNEEDINRHIDAVGHHQAETLAKKIKLKNLNIEHTYTSSACRATDTSAILCQQLGIGTQHISIEPNIYLNNTETLLSTIRELDSALSTVIFVGHNPSFSQLAADLTNNSSIYLSPGDSCLLQSQQPTWANFPCKLTNYETIES